MANVRATDGTAVVLCHKGKTIIDEFSGVSLPGSYPTGVTLIVDYNATSQNTTRGLPVVYNDNGWRSASALMDTKPSVTLPAITVPTLGSIERSNITSTGTIPPGMTAGRASSSPYTYVFYGSPTSAGVFNYTITVTQQVKNWRGTVQSEWLTYFPVEFHISTYSYLNLNANGGKFPDQSTVLTQSVDGYTAPTYTISTTTPTRAGYRFLGWSTSSTATSASYSGGGSYTGVLDGTSTLYAVWSLITYTHTITYNANGGSGSMGNTTVTDTNSGNSNVTFANNGFTAPANKHFIGWRINNTGTLYQPSNTYAVGGNGSVTAYAQWETNTYTVTIASNNTGYGTVSPTSIPNVPHGSSITVSGNTVTINGTTSTATAATQTAQYSYAFSSWSNATGTVTANLTITANFTRSTRSYTVTLTASAGGTVSGGGTYTYGSTANISATPDTNYVFSTWSDGNTSASRSLTVTGDVSLTATFAPTIAKTNVKVNGSWVKGSVYVRVNGSWVESKHIYINDNGTWEESVG